MEEDERDIKHKQIAEQQEENLLDIDTQEPIKPELEQAIKYMRNNKTPGVDHLPAEI